MMIIIMYWNMILLMSKNIFHFFFKMSQSSEMFAHFFHFSWTYFRKYTCWDMSKIIFQYIITQRHWADSYCHWCSISDVRYSHVGDVRTDVARDTRQVTVITRQPGFVDALAHRLIVVCQRWDRHRETLAGLTTPFVARIRRVFAHFITCAFVVATPQT